MDARLLQHFNEELAYLREMGQEFSDEFPQVAGRLGLGAGADTDPHVERLLEGCAFLSARIRLMLDAQTSAFAHRLVDLLQPSLLAPTPSMLIAQLLPPPTLAHEQPLPRGTGLSAPAVGASSTRCHFVTSQETWLTPARVETATLSQRLSQLPRPVTGSRPARSALTLQLRLPGDRSFDELAADRFRLFLNGPAATATQLLALMRAHVVAVHGGAPGEGAWWPQVTVEPAGLSPEEALLPCSSTCWSGLRLLQEHLAFPERSQFIDLRHVAPTLAATRGPVLELVCYFDITAEALEGDIQAQHFLLNCVPAINLFALRGDPLPVHAQQREVHLVPRRMAPMDHEVIAVTALTGVDESGVEHPIQGWDTPVGPDAFPLGRPLAPGPGDEDDPPPAYRFGLRREPRHASDRIRRRGPRSAYAGSEVFVNLSATGATSEPLHLVSPRLLCSNRDLPLSLAPTRPDALASTPTSPSVLMSSPDASSATPAANTRWSASGKQPLDAIHIVAGPSRPIEAAQDSDAITLIGLLALHHRPLSIPDGEVAARALRDWLLRLPQAAAPEAQRSLHAILQLEAHPAVRRHPSPGPIAFSRGIEIRLTVNEDALAGASAYPLGAALHGYLSGQAAINQWVALILLSTSGEEIGRWQS
ncbi:type VI secretion system protein ImpG [Roseateles sp. YR242]|uniref:type VI secretion system baseplate subunit TssF n=1 Tax=Roseateles sp. YR242 TaxID=1855305 RepID=UPI0008B48D81|nr:type VI secretion system baseplate subunit TssF [Roseateles sp. YR242]SEK22482.1 type VI secretion system protein ImpG [Roseateles sp. YR242]